MLYADTSALAKLVLAEPESEALRSYLRDRGGLISSALVVTELVRATRRLRPDLEVQARRLLATIALVDVDGEVLALATTLAPVEMRTLDAIHIATALALGDEIEAILTYDSRMIDAARGAGLHVDTPA